MRKGAQNISGGYGHVIKGSLGLFGRAGGLRRHERVGYCKTKKDRFSSKCVEVCASPAAFRDRGTSSLWGQGEGHTRRVVPSPSDGGMTSITGWGGDSL
eukprot:758819-Hanusia_phi.AAC.1